MKLSKIEHFLPDTADSPEHKSAVEMKELADNVAKDAGTSVTVFEVSKGTVILGFADDNALSKFDKEFEGVEGVKVTEITWVQFQRERNRERQNKVDAARATRKSKKAASSHA